MLFSLPDNDAWSHKNGPHAQVTSIAAADRQLERLMHAAGGPDAVSRAVRGDRDLRPLAGPGRGADPARQGVRGVRRRDPERSAFGRRRGRAEPGPAVGDDLRARSRAARQRGGAVARRGAPSSRGSTWCCGSPTPTRTRPPSAARRGELRFAPGGDLEDGRGASWSVEGDLATIRAEVQDGRLLCTEYPDALARAGRRCTARRGRRAAVGRPRATSSSTGAAPTTSAAAATVRCTAPIRSARCCGAAPARTLESVREQWSLRDVAPMVREPLRDRSLKRLWSGGCRGLGPG